MPAGFHLHGFHCEALQISCLGHPQKGRVVERLAANLEQAEFPAACLPGGNQGLPEKLFTNMVGTGAGNQDSARFQSKKGPAVYVGVALSGFRNG